LGLFGHLRRRFRALARSFVAGIMLEIKALSADAPVAQLDRASDFGSEGWGFESLRARQ
jgi:hypothetical protein